MPFTLPTPPLPLQYETEKLAVRVLLSQATNAHTDVHTHLWIQRQYAVFMFVSEVL